MAGFLFRLETPEGAPAQPSTLSSAVPNCRAGDTIHLGRRTLRVVDVRDGEADQPPMLIVPEASFAQHSCFIPVAHKAYLEGSPNEGSPRPVATARFPRSSGDELAVEHRPHRKLARKQRPGRYRPAA
jgi:hypothetical protein